MGFDASAVISRFNYINPFLSLLNSLRRQILLQKLDQNHSNIPEEHPPSRVMFHMISCFGMVYKTHEYSLSDLQWQLFACLEKMTKFKI